MVPRSFFIMRSGACRRNAFYFSTFFTEGNRQRRKSGEKAVSYTHLAGEPKVKRTIEGMKTYAEMTDGIWTCDGRSYAYRLEIRGRLSRAACDSVFVYLSNVPEISFERAAKAAGLSSNSDDYFAPEEAVLVELGTE